MPQPLIAGGVPGTQPGGSESSYGQAGGGSAYASGTYGSAGGSSYGAAAAPGTYGTGAEQQHQPASGPPAPARPGGTVYGGDSAPPVDSGNPYGAGTPGLRNVGGPANNQQFYPNHQQPAYQAPNPVETSGSLTGHILSQGRADTPTPNSRTAKVVIILAVVLVVMAGLGLLAATVFQDMISDVLGGIAG